MNFTPQMFLRALFDAAVAAAQPALCVTQHLPPPFRGRLIVLGAGKASAAMAQAVERHWQGEACGLAVTRYGYSVPCDRIEILEAGHPVPDAAGLAAARRILALAQSAGPDDRVLCLLSGGGSALMPLPLDGLALEDKRKINRALLASGAAISEMNTVRRHLSAIKGGRLAAAAYPARVLALVISDVPGDNPADIASGPTVADPTTSADALEILRRYEIGLPPGVAQVLGTPKSESIKPGDPRLLHSETKIIAAPQMALEAAAGIARAAGLAPYILGDAIEGEARDVGKVMAGLALQVARYQQPFAPPCVLLSGGETTVTVRGQGRGGRNTEFLLSLAIALGGRERIWAIAGDTDGVDGVAEIAGAIAGPDTLTRAAALGIKPHDALANNDAHGFFGALGDAVVTGPTHTNVNDFRAVLIA